MTSTNPGNSNPTQITHSLEQQHGGIEAQQRSSLLESSVTRSSVAKLLEELHKSKTVTWKQLEDWFPQETIEHIGLNLLQRANGYGVDLTQATNLTRFTRILKLTRPYLKCRAAADWALKDKSVYFQLNVETAHELVKYDATGIEHLIITDLPLLEQSTKISKHAKQVDSSPFPNIRTLSFGVGDSYGSDGKLWNTDNPPLPDNIEAAYPGGNNANIVSQIYREEDQRRLAWCRCIWDIFGTKENKPQKVDICLTERSVYGNEVFSEKGRYWDSICPLSPSTLDVSSTTIHGFQTLRWLPRFYLTNVQMFLENGFPMTTEQSSEGELALNALKKLADAVVSLTVSGYLNSLTITDTRSYISAEEKTLVFQTLLEMCQEKMELPVLSKVVIQERMEMGTRGTGSYALRIEQGDVTFTEPESSCICCGTTEGVRSLREQREIDAARGIKEQTEVVQQDQDEVQQNAENPNDIEEKDLSNRTCGSCICT